MAIIYDCYNNIEDKEVLITPFGRAKLNKYGYYVITSSKEGNSGKYLHVLVWENYWGFKKPENADIHHINGDKTDNRISNLQCLDSKVHQRYHALNANNSTGYFRVSIMKCKNCKQGFIYRYTYYENGKRKAICAVSIEKLEEKVKAKGLPWRKL